MRRPEHLPKYYPSKNCGLGRDLMTVELFQLHCIVDDRCPGARSEQNVDSAWSMMVRVGELVAGQLVDEWRVERFCWQLSSDARNDQRLYG